MTSVLVVGGVSWDTVVDLDRFPEPRPQTIFARGGREGVGSTGAGKALNLARLGVATTLHAPLGEDAPGRRAREALAEGGVRLEAWPDPAGTERHVNLMARDGGRISLYFAYGTFEPALELAPLEALAAAHDHVVVNVANYARRLLPALRARGAPVWTDVHDWDGRNPYHRDFVEAADVLFLSGEAMPDLRGFMAARVEAGASLVVATLGRDGALALERGGRWHAQPIAPGFEVVDTNGAGDAFFAGFLWARALGAPVEAALADAAIVAGLCVAAPGLVHPDLSPARVAAERRRVRGG